MTHVALQAAKAALACHQEHFGIDEDEMLLPVEMISVDDAIWVRVHDHASGQDRWVITYGFGLEDKAMARLADSEDLDSYNLDDWRPGPAVTKWTVNYTQIPTNYNSTYSLVVEAPDAQSAIQTAKDHLKDLGALARNDYKAEPYKAPAGKVVAA